ncbi:MAG: acyl-CoA dehydrogenase family protein [Deltaproteobacteria bacterium]|nr:acyl-CoA dehydrogenase family protein [Deltaproteobacteria bacterium]
MRRTNAEDLIRKTFAHFVEKEVKPVAKEVDEAARFPEDLFQKVARTGAFGIRYPQEAGGAGGNTTLFCIMCEELAKGMMGLAAITAMQCLMGTNFLFRYGTEDLREKYWLPAIKGRMVASFALTEPDAATDLGNVSTTAAKMSDGWVLNGMKTWITNGPQAAFFTVLASTDRSKGLKGLNFFFVPRDTPGVSVSKKFDKLGTRCTEISEVAFKDVRIPWEYMLGQEGTGVSNLTSILAEIRTMTAALSLGLARAALEDSIRYAKERVQFGRPIAQFQAIQMKIAQMAVGIEASKLLTYKAAGLVDQGINCTQEASMAKLFASETACTCADEATRIFASYAYSNEYPVQRYYRDTRFLLYGGGTSEILQINIAREMLK